MPVYQRKDGTYYVQFYYKSKTYIKTSGTNKTQAYALEATMRADLKLAEETGTIVEISYEKATEMFLDKIKGTSRYRNLSSISKWFEPHIKGKMLHEINTGWVNRTIAKKGNEGASNGTLKLYLQFINGCTSNAINLGYRGTTYTKPKIASTKNRLRYLSAEEEGRILDALTIGHENSRLNNLKYAKSHSVKNIQEDKDLFILLADTGARLQEIMQLEWKYVDLNSKLINLYRTKTKTESVMSMTDRVYEVLQRRKLEATTQWVFTDTHDSFRKSIVGLRATMDYVGLKDVRIHDIRHSYATKLIRNGVSLLSVSNLLGHSSTQMTLRYAHLSNIDISYEARDVLNNLNNQL